MDKKDGILTPLEMYGLDRLLQLLTRAKATGWSDAFASQADVSGALKSEGLGESNESFLPYPEPLATHRKAIADARACLEALNITRERLKRRLRALRRVSMPLVLKDGIKRLPDDVLATIFEIGHSMRLSDDLIFSCTHVSHVCRRFRQISLQTPTLWTRIHQTYGEGQIREFISRSGQLDLDVKLHGSIGGSKFEPFLMGMKRTSHRWTSICIPDEKTKTYMTGLGITDLPRLRHLIYTYPADLSTFSMPRLSQFEGYGSLLPAGRGFLPQLTHVELHLWRDGVGVAELANTLHGMRNIRDLSLNLLHCTVDNESLPMDSTAFPKPRSVHIDRLSISIVGEMRQYSALLFDALMHLTPSTFKLSMNSENTDFLLFNSKFQIFPYSPIVKFHIPTRIEAMGILQDLMKGCDIVRTIEFDTSKAVDPVRFRTRLLRDDDWERIRSLDHLRFINCDEFSEIAVGAFANKFLRGKTKTGLQCLELISCKKISEDFLLELKDEFGDSLKWTL
ncbi:hypothetical protein BD410DRAFT_792307 [Rickenella mellea]|uniref:F-box domain-containing protein n=1 Tax=Rickenella mellea TaxID=50990 RepID=A0A4Y7PV35_9AGAM|nr:hypothetical protein BD410DRAFT_792307 [Rickenella mellea]